MKNQFISIALLFVIYGCTENNHNLSNEIKSTEKRENIIIEQEVEKDDSLVISKIEAQFFESVKEYDRENNENSSSRFHEIFNTHKIRPYDLYLEITSAYKLADDEARKSGVEIKANGDERKTEKYFSVLRIQTETETTKIKTKYNLDHDLFMLFQNNFCFCYSGNDDFYCEDGTCVLRNGEYWE